MPAFSPAMSLTVPPSTFMWSSPAHVVGVAGETG